MDADQILVVEDDPEMLVLVRVTLEGAGFEVWPAGSGSQALEMVAQRGLPDLALIDLMLPGMHGFELSESLQQFSDLPIVFLTAVTKQDTIIEGIERFAEDYITKPFHPRELVARLNRVLNRMGDRAARAGASVKVDERLTLDLVGRRAILDGQAVGLSPTETKLLHILLREAGRTVATEVILRRLWPLEEVYEEAVRVNVHRLRKKIEADPDNPRYILTERGVGYCFAKDPVVAAAWS